VVICFYKHNKITSYHVVWLLCYVVGFLLCCMIFKIILRRGLTMATWLRQPIWFPFPDLYFVDSIIMSIQPEAIVFTSILTTIFKWTWLSWFPSISSPPLVSEENFWEHRFLQPDVLPAAQQIVSEHCRKCKAVMPACQVTWPQSFYPQPHFWQREE